MSIVDKIVDTQDLATLPSVATKILDFMESDDVSLSDLSRIIESDPALTLKIIKVANSPIYATRNEIVSIFQAVTILGLNRITNIVLGISIFSNFLIAGDKNLELLVDRFWWHSSCTALVAKSIAGKINASLGEKEFLVGLLHDIGKLAMMQYDPTEYQKVIELSDFDEMSHLESERKFFGTDHIEVASAIGKKWDLPSEISSLLPLELQEDMNELDKNVVAVVEFANKLCEIWGAGFYQGIHSINFEAEWYWQQLKMTFSSMKDFDVEMFTLDLEHDFSEATNFLELVKA
jgi:HD-like signal output (HDOD) protein